MPAIYLRDCELIFHRNKRPSDGSYHKYGKTMFRPTNGPDGRELDNLLHTISKRVAGYLERLVILERDEENSYLQRDNLQEDPMQQLIGHSGNLPGSAGKADWQKGIFSPDTASI